MSDERKESVERIFEGSQDTLRPRVLIAEKQVQSPSLESVSKADVHGSDSLGRRIFEVKFPDQLIQLFSNRLTGNRKTSEHIEIERYNQDLISLEIEKQEQSSINQLKQKSSLSSIQEEYQEGFEFDSPEMKKRISRHKEKNKQSHRFGSQQVVFPQSGVDFNKYSTRPKTSTKVGKIFLGDAEGVGSTDKPAQVFPKFSSIRVREPRALSIAAPAVQEQPQALPTPSKTQVRLFGFLMVFCYCMMIVISKYSKSRGVELSFVRGVTGLCFSFVYNKFNPEPFYFREGYAMEKFMLRGFLGALTFTLQMTANQLLNSAIFIVMSRMKVFFTLILSTLFNSEVVNFKLILLTVVAFFGVCLVMDPSIFGLPTMSDPQAIRIIGLPREIFAIGLCVIYMIISSISRALMIYATVEMNNTQAFFFLSIFNIINSSVVFVWEPMVWRSDEIIIYIAISVTSILFIYAFLFFLTYEQDMLIFIMIQTSIVGITFLIDITLFGTQFNAYNLIGVLLVIAASFSVLLL